MITWALTKVFNPLTKINPSEVNERRYAPGIVQEPRTLSVQEIDASVALDLVKLDYSQTLNRIECVQHSARFVLLSATMMFFGSVIATAYLKWLYPFCLSGLCALAAMWVSSVVIRPARIARFSVRVLDNTSEPKNGKAMAEATRSLAKLSDDIERSASLYEDLFTTAYHALTASIAFSILSLATVLILLSNAVSR